MKTSSEILRFCGEIGKTFNPSKIILFGSYARGTAREDSDVDLLVAMPGNARVAQLADRMITELNPRFAVDLIVKSEREIARRIKQNDFFLRQAIREGHLIYEAPNA